jgi:hypothetical protein
MGRAFAVSAVIAAPRVAFAVSAVIAAPRVAFAVSAVMAAPRVRLATGAAMRLPAMVFVVPATRGVLGPSFMPPVLAARFLVGPRRLRAQSPNGRQRNGDGGVAHGSHHSLPRLRNHRNTFVFTSLSTLKGAPAARPPARKAVPRGPKARSGLEQRARPVMLGELSRSFFTANRNLIGASAWRGRAAPVFPADGRAIVPPRVRVPPADPARTFPRSLVS